MDSVSVEPAQRPRAESEPSRVRRPRRDTILVSLAALGVYLVLTLLLFLNTWVHPFDATIGSQGDPPLIMWFLGWSAFALSHVHNPLFSTYIDYPVGVNLMWNTAMPLPTAILAPITATLGPVFSYNVMETLAIVFSALAAFILIQRYVPNPIAAGFGGLVYGFSPGMMAQSLGHPHLTLAFLPPLMFIAVDEMVRIQRRSPLVIGALLGLLGVGQLLIGEETLLTSAMLAAIALVILAAVFPGEVRPRLAHFIRGVVAAGVVFTVLAAPFLAFQFLGPQHIHGIVHGPNEFVSDVLSFFVPTQLSLIAPTSAVRLTEKFTGNVSEWNSYVGIPMVLLLTYIAIRYWRLLIVRLATMVGALLAIFSLGVTLHFSGYVSHLPVFTLGLAFPLLARFIPGMPGLTLLYTTFVGWFAMSRLPIFIDILPSRIMLLGYLAIGLLLAVFIEQLLVSRRRRLELAGGLAATALALLFMAPVIPYWSTPAPVPDFFKTAAAQRIPEKSVALIMPMADSGDPRPMFWQAVTGMRFKMPEGYAYIPAGGANVVDPPFSVTHENLRAIRLGQASVDTINDATRAQIRTELHNWNVKTVVVGPMEFQNDAVAFFTELFSRPPDNVAGVYVWSNL